MQNFCTNSESFRSYYIDEYSALIPSETRSAALRRIDYAGNCPPSLQNYLYRKAHTDELLFPLAAFLEESNKKLRIGAATISTLTGDTIARIRNFEDILRSADNRISYYPHNNGIPEITILNVSKYCNAFTDALTTAGFQDTKPLSLTLQTHKNHKTRVIELPANDNYQNPAVILITNEINVDYMYRVFALIPYLTAKMLNIQLPNNIVDIYAALGNKDITSFNTAYRAYIDSVDFYSEHTKNLLKNFIEGTYENTKDNYIASITNLRSSIEGHYRNINTCYAQKIEFERKLFALEHNPQEDLSEFVDFVVQNKDKIQIIGTSGSLLKLSIQVPMSYWNEEQLEIILNNKSPNATVNRNKILRWFLENTFAKKRFTMMSEIQLALNFQEKRIQGFYDDIHNNRYKDYKYYPNPHLAIFACLGSNGTHISKSLQENDYIYALNAIMAAVSSINWHDGPVTNKFFEHLIGVFKHGSYAEHEISQCRRAHWQAVIIRDQDGKEYTTANLPTLFEIDTAPPAIHTTPNIEPEIPTEPATEENPVEFGPEWGDMNENDTERNEMPF